MAKKQESKVKSKAKPKKEAKVEKVEEECGCGEVHEDGCCQDTTSIILEHNPQRAYAPVSYTHLTLPTNREV